MTTTPSLAEQRAELQKHLNEIDLNRAKQAKAIFESKGFTDALKKLEALGDETDQTALHRSAEGDVTALIANLLVPFRNGPVHADRHIARLEAALAPPPPVAEVAPNPPE